MTYQSIALIWKTHCDLRNFPGLWHVCYPPRGQEQLCESCSGQLGCRPLLPTKCLMDKLAISNLLERMYCRTLAVGEGRYTRSSRRGPRANDWYGTTTTTTPHSRAPAPYRGEHGRRHTCMKSVLHRKAHGRPVVGRTSWAETRAGPYSPAHALEKQG